MDTLFFNIASLIGTAAFGLSGFMVGARKNLDIMGVFILVALTANGGGTIRDIILNRPLILLTDMLTIYLLLSITAIGFVMKIHRYTSLERRMLFVVSDSIGLVAFSITGALVAIDSGLNIFGVIIIAFLSSTGGGILRDLLANEVPTVLSSEFYGSVSIIIAIMLYILAQSGVVDNFTISVVFAIGLAIRLVAHFRDWHLPRI